VRAALKNSYIQYWALNKRVMFFLSNGYIYVHGFSLGINSYLHLKGQFLCNLYYGFTILLFLSLISFNNPLILSEKNMKAVKNIQNNFGMHV